MYKFVALIMLVCVINASFLKVNRGSKKISNGQLLVQTSTFGDHDEKSHASSNERHSDYHENQNRHSHAQLPPPLAVAAATSGRRR